ncbi:MAG: DUF4139 domain-containing protein, partial [Elusimicrobiota bacterium]
DNNPERTIKAKLLRSKRGNMVYEIDGEIYPGHPGIVVIPDKSDKLVTKPTLLLRLINKKKNSYLMELDYLTSNISWKCDYILSVDNKMSSADLSSLITLENQTGTSYKDAKIKLIAGELNRERERERRGVKRAEIRYEAMASAPGFTQSAVHEYHMYSLNRITSIKDKQEKQISFIKAQDIDVEKEFLIYGKTGYFRSRYSNKDKEQEVGVYISFENKKKYNLGMPLPAGIVRVYQEDKENSLQFIGENRIKHTPENEEIKIKTGNAFDIKCERVQTDYRRIDDDIYETQWEITLRNQKDEDIKVGIIEPMRGDWKVINSSEKYDKTGAFSIRFDLEIPKKQERKISYRVRIEY